VARLILNAAQVDKTKSKAGRDLVRPLAKEIRLASVAEAPKKTGAMVASSYIDYQENGSGYTAVVGYSSVVAFWQHEGTPPHREPKTAPGPMSFFWEKMGRWVVLPHLTHPGVKPNRFLTTPMKRIARAKGWKAVSYRIGP
jgi:hypothetical protein